jgi:mono/diheme cytochrome c family protein
MNSKVMAVVLAMSFVAGLAVNWLIANRPERPEPTAAAPPPVVILFRAAESLAALSEERVSAGRTAGEALYNRYQCVGCHSDKGRSLKRLFALGNRYDLASLDVYLKSPTPPMPIFPLSDEDRANLSIYLIDRYPGKH